MQKVSHLILKSSLAYHIRDKSVTNKSVTDKNIANKV